MVAKPFKKGNKRLCEPFDLQMDVSAIETIARQVYRWPWHK